MRFKKAFFVLTFLFVIFSMTILGSTDNVLLNWYQDGNFSGNGINGSTEQFYVYFNTGVKNANFKIIIPDRTKEDPYGKDAYKVINKNTHNDSVPKKNEISLFVRGDACGSDNFRDGFSSRFILELTADWTYVFDTEKTGFNYYDSRFNPIKLVAENFVIEVDQKETPIQKVESVNNLTLKKDIYPPKVVYQLLLSSAKGDSHSPLGSVGVMFNEPVQIKSPHYVSPRGHRLHTPPQNQDYVYFQAKYVLIEENNTHIIKADEIEGLYDGKSCAHLSTLTETRAVNGMYDYDVHIFDSNNRLRCIRNFGWHYIVPEKDLSPGKWKLIINNIVDSAYNKMEQHEMIIEIEETPFLTIKEVNNTGIIVEYTNPIQSDGRMRLVIDEPGSERLYAIFANVKKGDKIVEFKFNEKFEKLPSGVWRINGIEVSIK